MYFWIDDVEDVLKEYGISFSVCPDPALSIKELGLTDPQEEQLISHGITTIGDVMEIMGKEGKRPNVIRKIRLVRRTGIFKYRACINALQKYNLVPPSPSISVTSVPIPSPQRSL